ncbi:MAG TPA: hypothetical protein VGX23_37665 [Actinocrinis sp.]|nr:hypothetical protein [Actinocrinis sp.]
MPVAQLSSVESFVHRDYAVLFGALPALALGSIATFVQRDRAAARTGAPDPQAGPARDLAVAGVVLALIAERLDLDPLGYPLLALAAARLVDQAGPADRAAAARRAAADVIRPLALSTLVRAAVCGLAG